MNPSGPLPLFFYHDIRVYENCSAKVRRLFCTSRAPRYRSGGGSLSVA